MKRLPFYFADVFAEKKYAGNQLAVFRGAGELSSAEMQNIAREVNFSETTFILSEQPIHGGFDVCIFTPKEEVPFAGHPTIGTAYIIRNEILKGKAEKVVLNLKVGQIPVTFSQDGYTWMKQIQPIFGWVLDSETISQVLQLDVQEIDIKSPIQEVSTGLPFIIIPLKTLESLKRVRININKYFNHRAFGSGLHYCKEAEHQEGSQNHTGNTG
jgi:trans-2,3-dihydro-3-hydroxyanthranilate isomerase